MHVRCWPVFTPQTVALSLNPKPQLIVYDADITRGGSSGPVLTSAGELVAVNAAIQPEYGGSNLGTFLAKITRLMRSLELE